MVVAEQVQHAVDQQLRELVVERTARAARLARGLLDVDHDVAEQRAAVLAVGALDEREREHVGRTGLAAVRGVQLPIAASSTSASESSARAWPSARSAARARAPSSARSKRGSRAPRAGVR